MTFETLEDLEIFMEKINVIRKVYKDSERLRIRELYHITEHLSNTSRAIPYLLECQSTETTLKKINKLKKFIERL